MTSKLMSMAPEIKSMMSHIDVIDILASKT